MMRSLTVNDRLQLAAAYMAAAQALRNLHELRMSLGYVSLGQAQERIEELEASAASWIDSARKKIRARA